MSLFQQLFHSKSTEDPQASILLRLQAVENDHSHIKRELSALSEQIKDEADKTRQRLDRYRARAQPRLNGKFAAQDASDGQNGRGDVVNPQESSHAKISALAREKGMTL